MKLPKSVNYRIIDGNLREVYYNDNGKPVAHRSPAFGADPHSDEFYGEVDEELEELANGNVIMIPEIDFTRPFTIEDLERAPVEPAVIQPAGNVPSRDELIQRKIEDYNTEIASAWKEAKSLPSLTESDFS